MSSSRKVTGPRRRTFFWDNLGQLAGKSGRTALLSDIARNCKALFWKESFRKSLIGLKAFSPCKAVDAGSIPTPASRFYCGSMAADASHRNVSSNTVGDWLQGPAKGQDVGRVVELGYTRHLKCLGASHTGSNPVSPTRLTGIEVFHDRV